MPKKLHQLTKCEVGDYNRALRRSDLPREQRDEALAVLTKYQIARYLDGSECEHTLVGDTEEQLDDVLADSAKREGYRSELLYQMRRLQRHVDVIECSQAPVLLDV